MSRHLEPDELAAVALGDASAEHSAHVASCTECRDEVTALQDVLVRARSAGPVALVAPPERVWQAITAQIAADETSDNGPTPVEPLPLTATAPAPDDVLAARRAGKSQRWWWIGSAAAAGIVIGAVGATAIGVGGVDEGTVIASAPLARLADEAPAGTADVVERADGTEVLVIDTPAQRVDGAYLEVWLIDTSVEGMISLGPLTSDHEEFVIPAGFDVEAHPIVDISVEPLDGVPTHSGDSVTRGILTN